MLKWIRNLTLHLLQWSIFLQPKRILQKVGLKTCLSIAESEFYGVIHVLLQCMITSPSHCYFWIFCRIHSNCQRTNKGEFNNEVNISPFHCSFTSIQTAFFICWQSTHKYLSPLTLNFPDIYFISGIFASSLYFKQI